VRVDGSFRRQGLRSRGPGRGGGKFRETPPPPPFFFGWSFHWPTTTPQPTPAVTKLPAIGHVAPLSHGYCLSQRATPFSTGMDSPVKADSSTCRFRAATNLRSAGILAACLQADQIHPNRAGVLGRNQALLALADHRAVACAPSGPAAAMAVSAYAFLHETDQRVDQGHTPDHQRFSERMDQGLDWRR